MDLTLPFDQTVIQRILPHRYPFLLVDRIIEFEPDKRIVGIKNISRNEKSSGASPGRTPTIPFTILTEAVAQVGAIMILGKPENRDQLIFFMGIDKVRFRHPVNAGDQVEIVATVKRLRSRMGTLHGEARVNGRVCAEGTMTFALGARRPEGVVHRLQGNRDRRVMSSGRNPHLSGMQIHHLSGRRHAPLSNDSTVG